MTTYTKEDHMRMAEGNVNYYDDYEEHNEKNGFFNKTTNAIKNLKNINTDKAKDVAKSAAAIAAAKCSASFGIAGGIAGITVASNAAVVAAPAAGIYVLYKNKDSILKSYKSTAEKVRNVISK